MKKLFTLVMVAALAIPAFAQFTQKTAYDFSSKKAIAPKFQMNQAKSGAGSELTSYPYALGQFLDIELDFASYPLQYDTLGIMPGGWHPNVHGWCMTFDFTNDVWDYHNYDDNGEEIPTVSLRESTSLNIDSITIVGGYFRHENTPAGTKDTIIVGFLTDIDTNTLQTLSLVSTGDFVISFYEIGYDMNTGVQTNAVVYKFPIDDSNVSQEEGDSYYGTVLTFPIGINNVSAKIWDVAYTFKRGYELGLNDTLTNASYFYAWLYTDPRADYPIVVNGNYNLNNEVHQNNMNQGGSVDTETRYGVTSGSWSDGIYTPNPFWGEFHYPYMMLDISCNDCAWVNVPEMEQDNVTVYPNPATSNITVTTGSNEKVLVEMFNLVGQKVYSENVIGNTNINVSNMKPGVYMLRVNNTTKKVVVK